MDKKILTEQIKRFAEEQGFFLVGMAKAQFMEQEAKNLESWLNNNYHGKLQYMENYFDKRVDPSKLVPGAKTVISLAFNYFTEETQKDPAAPKIASYAYGKDYHHILKEKLRHILDYIQVCVGDVDARVFVDSAPVLERDWAKRAGLGWIGKHTLLLSKKKGSFFFLAEIILDVEFEYDEQVSDHCGSCTRCIDACPTDAINERGYIVDASKCISYLTIELKEEIPKAFKNKMENWMFGCDICQQVCPWNRFSVQHSEPEFLPHPDLLEMTKNDWQEITREVFNKVFKKSAVKRAKFEGLISTIDFLK